MFSFAYFRSGADWQRSPGDLRNSRPRESVGFAMSAGYKGLRETAAWLDLSGRGKIRVTGEDRARLLHAMCSQNIEVMQPGDGVYAFFLNAQGRILADANIFCFDDHFLLDTERETARKVFEHLDRYIIADDVTLADDTDTTATLAVEGPAAERVLQEICAQDEVLLPVPAGATVPWKGAVVARVDFTGAPGYFIFLPASAKDEFAGKLSGLPQADADEARVVRIENGRPRYGEEITERYLVQETGQLRGVHFSKGCYLGQEIVERVRSRAQIHRVLRRLELDTKELPAAGTKLNSTMPGGTPGGTLGSAASAEAAEIVSSAFSPALGKAVALAYVRTPFAEPGTIIDTGSFTARVS
jgi:folate-binding protein YgfZ